MNILPEFRPGSGAKHAHRALKSSVAAMDRAQHSAVLWFGEIMQRHLYRQLGYSSIRQYAIEGLGFSRSRAGHFMRLASRLEALPVVKKEVAAGRLGYTKAREIAAVADPGTEKAWVKVAKAQSRLQLEATVRHAKEVAKVNPAQTTLLPAATVPPVAVRTRVTFELSAEQLARYESLVAELGPRGDKGDLLLEMAAALVERDSGAKNAPRGTSRPPHQIHVHECPRCKRATVQTARGEVELAPAELEAVRCDARICEPGKRSTSTIPPSVRRDVLARDRNRCRRKGCNHSQFLHLHHIRPRSRGGTHHPSNLVTLCSACHLLWHRKGGNLAELLEDVPGLDPGPANSLRK